MPDIGNVLGFYEFAEEKFKLKQYKEAASYYRQCYITFEIGELPIYMESLEIAGRKSFEIYQIILKRYLTPDDRKIFEDEDNAYGGLEQSFGC